VRRKVLKEICIRLFRCYDWPGILRVSLNEGQVRQTGVERHSPGMSKLPKCTKAIAYVRVSTAHQEISPDVQRERIEAYCKLAGLILIDVIVECGVSAKIRLAKRPSASKLAALLKQGVCHVIALKLDRLFRNAADALATTEEWNRIGVRLHLVDLGGSSVDTSSSTGRMFLTMLAAFAEFERNVIGERTSAALQHLSASGKVLGQAPFGFDVIGSRLVVNDAEQAVLARLRAMRSAGGTFRGIAATLNAEALPCKRTGTCWHAAGIQKLLAPGTR
jgi:site-specific DNA recombinase